MNDTVSAAAIQYHATVRAMVREVLQRPAAFEWSLQGFGMFRLYFGQRFRLHLWDSRFAVRNVSLMHDHPWDFESLVIAGEIHNYRYSEIDNQGAYYNVQQIQCGPGGCTKGEIKEARLVECGPEIYVAGERYSQQSLEIHKSIPRDGTVTLIDRKFHGDTEHARVLWPLGYTWVSAEPRPAAHDEIKRATELSLATWFEDDDK